MAGRRLPWIKLWIEGMAHEKVALLTDAQFRTWVMVLCAGAQQPVRWRFASTQHASVVSGRPVAHIRHLLKVRLLDEPEDGGLWVHDHKQWQDVYESDLALNGRRDNSPNAPPMVLHRSEDAPPKTPARTRAPAQKGEGRPETGEERPETGDLPPPGPEPSPGGAGGGEHAASAAASLAPRLEGQARSRASSGAERVAAVVDLVRAQGVEIHVSGRDGKAVKDCTAPPELIAAAYVSAVQGEWGGDVVRDNLALWSVIPRLASYQASKNSTRGGSGNGKPSAARGGAGSVRHI